MPYPAALSPDVSPAGRLEGGGRVGEYAGGYTDWLRQRPPVADPSDARATPPKRPAPAPPPRPPKKRKLSFRETSELAELPDRIDALEREREQVYASLADPAVLRDGAAVTAAKARLAALEGEVAELTARWEAATEELAAAEAKLGRESVD